MLLVRSCVWLALRCLQVRQGVEFNKITSDLRLWQCVICSRIGPLNWWKVIVKLVVTCPQLDSIHIVNMILRWRMGSDVWRDWFVSENGAFRFDAFIVLHYEVKTTVCIRVILGKMSRISPTSVILMNDNQFCSRRCSCLMLRGRSGRRYSLKSKWTSFRPLSPNSSKTEILSTKTKKTTW